MYSTLPRFGILFVTEVIKLLIVMNGIFGFEFNRNKKQVATGSAAVLAFIFAVYIFFGKYSDVLIVLMPVSSIILVYIYTKTRKKLIFLILAEISLCGIDEAMGIVVNKVVESDYKYVVTSSFTVIVASLISFILHRRRKKGLEAALNNVSTFYLVTLVVAQFVAGYFLNELYSKSGMFRLRMFIIFAAIMFVEAALIFTLNQRNFYHNLSVVNQQMLESKERYYMKLLDHENEIRKFRHDVKNHFLSIEALLADGKYSEASAYVAEIKNSFAFKSPEIKTGNTIVSAIASDYVSRFPDAELEWNGLIPEKLNISNVDICTVFSNILANAFENAVKSETEKKVAVIIQTVNNSMIITVKNNIGAPVIRKDGVFETTKEDSRNHGIGTQNVKSCVEAHKGIVEYSYDDKFFEVRIILPNVLNLF